MEKTVRAPVTPEAPNTLPTDVDPIETREWQESFDAVARDMGPDRALYLLGQLESRARDQGIFSGHQPFSAYRNTISLERQGSYPGNLELEEQITAVMRWNALAMVV